MNLPFPLTDYDKILTLRTLVFSHMGTQTQLSKSVTFTNIQESVTLPQMDLSGHHIQKEGARSEVLLYFFKTSHEGVN